MDPYYLTAAAFIFPSRIVYEIYNLLLQLEKIVFSFILTIIRGRHHALGISQLLYI